MPISTTSEHHAYRVKMTCRRPKHLYVALCACGWRSEQLPTAGMCGTAFDLHVVDRGER